MSASGYNYHVNLSDSSHEPSHFKVIIDLLTYRPSLDTGKAKRQGVEALGVFF